MRIIYYIVIKVFSCKQKITIFKGSMFSRNCFQKYYSKNRNQIGHMSNKINSKEDKGKMNITLTVKQIIIQNKINKFLYI